LRHKIHTIAAFNLGDWHFVTPSSFDFSSRSRFGIAFHEFASFNPR